MGYFLQDASISWITIWQEKPKIDTPDNEHSRKVLRVFERISKSFSDISCFKMSKLFPRCKYYYLQIITLSGYATNFRGYAQY
jgi:hypothetical protein